MPSLSPEDGSGEVLLLGGVPLGGQQQGKALTGVGHKACGTRADRAQTAGKGEYVATKVGRGSSTAKHRGPMKQVAGTVVQGEESDNQPGDSMIALISSALALAKSLKKPV